MRARVCLVAGVAMVVACGGDGGGGDAGDADLPEAASHDAVPGDGGADTARDVPVHVGRDVIVDAGGGADIRRDVPRDVRDVPGTHRDVARDVPSVHRDTGGDAPSRDAHKG